MIGGKDITIGGIPVDLLDDSAYKKVITSIIDSHQKNVVLYTNARAVVEGSKTYLGLRRIYEERADYVICDGDGIRLAARFLSRPIPNKNAYNVWFWDFARYCGSKNYRIFFLGSSQEIVTRAADNVMRSAPGLHIAAHQGYFNKSKDHPENIDVIRIINLFSPHILLVGFGIPMQEKWIDENIENLDVNAVFACGDAFSFFSGNKKVAPLILRKMNLEWLHRILQDPRNMSKRYISEFTKFVYYIIKEKVRGAD